LTNQQGNKLITPLYDTILDKAINDAQNALAMGNADYAWLMLKKLAFSTGNEEIITECDRIFLETQNRIKVMNAGQSSLSTISAYFARLQTKNFLNDQCLETYKRIMLLLEKNGYLENLGVHPRCPQPETLGE
jgi:hypothetical protein